MPRFPLHATAILHLRPLGLSALLLAAGFLPPTNGNSTLAPATTGLSVTASPKFIDRAEQQADLAVTYFIKNTTAATVNNIALTCSATGMVACVSIDLTLLTSLAAGATIDIDLHYATGAAGSGTITLTATASTASGAGPHIVTVIAPPTITIVVPTLSSGSRAVVRTRQPVVRVSYLGATTNPNAAVDSSTLLVTWRGRTVTSEARINRGLLEWEPDSAHGLGTVGTSTADSAALTVHACAVIGSCQTVSRWIVLPSDQKPILGFSGVPYEALGRAFSAPFGPGLSVTAGEVEAGVSTVPYVSLGTPRSTGLVYSTRQSYPRGPGPGRPGVDLARGHAG